jgi:predicted lipoprotein with Yx(FWY)xxD motif
VSSHSVRRSLVVGGTLLAALTACGSEQQGGQQEPAGGQAAATRDIPGVGMVLVDPAGKTLYFTDNDSAGAIKCVDECLKLWTPAAAPSDGAQGANMGVTKRPDGTSQLTYQNKPLYTFTMDTKDQPASGNNATDSFGGVDFTWHAVVVSAANQPPTSGNDGGYGGGGGY